MRKLSFCWHYFIPIQSLVKKKVLEEKGTKDTQDSRKACTPMFFYSHSGEQKMDEGTLRWLSGS